MKALILAGGFATRLGPIGQEIPKAMLMLNGDTLLGHQLREFKKIGAEPFVLTNERFKDAFKDCKNVLVEKSSKEEEKPGAVSAINNFIREQGIDEDLLITCSDNYFSEGFEGFVKNYSGKPLTGVYYAGSTPELNPKEMGTLKFEDCDRYPPPKRSFKITEFKEKAENPASDYVATGIYLYPKDVFSEIDAYCKGEKRDQPGGLIEHFISKGMDVIGYHFEGQWQDISEKSYLKDLGKGRLIKRDNRYIVVDKSVGNLGYSITILSPGKETTGHAHPVGEVFFFTEGQGVMEIEGVKRTVRSGDAISVEPRHFHKIYNTSKKDLVFLCVFEKYGDRG